MPPIKPPPKPRPPGPAYSRLLFNGLLAQAIARYPDEHPAMAAEMLASDRRHAGMGALRKEPRNGWRSPVQNTKRDDIGRNGIVYEMYRFQPARMVDDPQAYPLDPRDPADVVVSRLVPEMRLDIRRVFEYHEMRDRGLVAHALRHMRRKLRAEVARRLHRGYPSGQEG